MFEMFTVRARKVIELGRTEAKRSGDDCVGTQHILFGLVKEASGIGHHILETNGVTIPMILSEIIKVVVPSPFTEFTEKDPKFSPRARKIFEHAIEEATALGHRYVGTEHILLGLLKGTESIAVQILTNFGLNIEQLRKETLQLLGFYDKDYQFKPTDDDNKIWSVIIAEAGVQDVIGRYDTNSDELLFNRPFSIDEIQRIISVLRRCQNDKDRV